MSAPAIVTRTPAAFYPATRCLRCGQEHVTAIRAHYCIPCAEEGRNPGPRPARIEAQIDLLARMGRHGHGA